MVSSALAHAAKRVAHLSEWQTEIIFAQNAPAVWPGDRRRRAGGHIPAVELGMPNEPVSGTPQQTQLVEIADLILDQDQARAPALQVKAAQHLHLMALHVDRHEID